MAFGDIFVIGRGSDRVYQYNGTTWDTGLAIPTAENDPRGVAVDPDNSDILIVGTGANRVYRHNGTSWDSGLAVPTSETLSQDVAVDPDNGDILIVGQDTDKIYRHNGTSWDTGLDVPSTESSARGLTVDPDNGDILISGTSGDRVYRYNGTSWDSGLAVPTAESFPNGVAVDYANGDILVVGLSRRVYRYNGTSWDTGLAVPAAETNPTGVAIDGNFPTDDFTVDADTSNWTFALPQPSVTSGQERFGDASTSNWVFDLPEPAVSRLTLTETVEVDSESDFTDAFTGETTGTDAGFWRYDSGGSSASSNTGPGTNNTLSFMHTETSGLGDVPTAEANGIAEFAFVPDRVGRKLHMRLCIQGQFGNGEEGLEIEQRANDSETWTQTGFAYGWSYSNSRDAGDTFQDENDVTQTVAADGGWVDFEFDIPDTATQVRLQPRYITGGGGSTFHHDIAVRSFFWSWPTVDTVDYEVDAGDADWTFSLPQPSVTLVEPVDHTVDAGDANWTFTLPEPGVTRDDIDHIVAAGTVAWEFTVPQPGSESTTEHTVDAGDVDWEFVLPTPSVTSGGDHQVNAGDANWTFTLPEPSVDLDRQHEITPAAAAWDFALPQPAVTSTGSHAVDAANANWVFDLPQPSVAAVTFHAVDAGGVTWVVQVPQPTITSSKNVDAGAAEWLFELPLAAVTHEGPGAVGGVTLDDDVSTRVRYRWFLYRLDGSLVGLYDTDAAQPFVMEWSKSLNRIGNCKVHVPRGHDMETHIDPDDPAAFLLLERSVGDVVPRRIEWAGIIRTASDVSEPRWQGTNYTGVSLEWMLDSRALFWPPDTDRRTVWTGETAATIASDLILYNSGPNATTANGRWRDGTWTWPAIDTAITGSDIVTEFTGSDSSVFEHLRDLASIHDYAFRVEWNAPATARFHFGPRPLTTDRTQDNGSKLLLAERWGQVEKFRSTVDLQRAATVVAVRHQQDVDALPVQDSSPTPASLHTLVALPSSALAREALITQSSSDRDPESDGQARLDEDQHSAADASVEVNLSRVVYGRDFDLGDRVLIETRQDRTPLEAEVTMVSGKYTVDGGEVLDVRFSLPRSGLYGS